MAYKMKMHLKRGSKIVCNTFSKRPKRTTNVLRMETCRRCSALARKRGLYGRT